MPLDNLAKDPDFLALPIEEQRKGFADTDPDFAALPHEEQLKGVADLTGQPIIDITADGGMKSVAEDMNDGTPYNAGTLKEAIGVSKKFDVDNFIPSRKTVADFARPVFEGGGAVLGALGGSALATPVVGGIAGAGLGYATGKKLADFVEGAPPPESMLDATIGTVNDVATGATLEMGGLAAANVLGRGLTAATNGYRGFMRGTPAITKSGIEAKAGQVIADNTGTAPIYAQNADEAAKLNIPGFKPSMGEARNDPGLIKLQRGIERMDGTPGTTIMEAKAANQAAVKDYLENQFTGNESIDDVVNALTARKVQIEATTGQAERTAEAARGNLNPADPQTVGRSIADELDTAIAPLKAAEREAWANVPNYPVPSSNFDDVAHELKNTPLHVNAESTVNDIINYANRMPRTTEGMRKIEELVGDIMFDPNTTPNTKRVVGQFRRAIADDFKAMGEAADAGDIALFEGKVVNPGKLQAERDTMLNRIATEKIAADSSPDIPTITAALRDAGDPPNQWMRQVNETPQQYSTRLVARYNRIVGDTTPTLSAELPSGVVQANERIASIDKVLGGAEPAENLATALRTAKDVSKERFDRFGKGVISDIMKDGNQASGGKLPDALVPAKVFTLDGADDFIRSVGKEKAAVHADQFAAHDLLSKANPLTGEIPAKTVAAWMKKNSTVLRKYGISGKYSTVAKAQAQAEIAQYAEVEFTKSAASRILNADVDKAMASAFASNPSNTGAVVDDLLKAIGQDPQGIKGLQNAFKDFLVNNVQTTAKTLSGDAIISPAAIQKQMVKYAPAMRKLYANDPSKIAALNRVSKAVELQNRSAKSPIGGGSDTAENLNMARSILGRAVEMVPGAGWAVRLGKVGLDRLNDLNAKELNKVIARALYDPDFAQTLAMAAKRYKPEVVQRRVNSHLMTLGMYAAKPKNGAATEDNDPLGIRD